MQGREPGPASQLRDSRPKELPTRDMGMKSIPRTPNGYSAIRVFLLRFAPWLMPEQPRAEAPPEAYDRHKVSGLQRRE